MWVCVCACVCVHEYIIRCSCVVYIIYIYIYIYRKVERAICVRTFRPQNFIEFYVSRWWCGEMVKWWSMDVHGFQILATRYFADDVILAVV